MKKCYLLMMLILPYVLRAQIISTYVSTGIDDPGYMVFDSIGNLYVTENTYKVQKIDNMGVVTTIAGTGGIGFSGDGGPATAALLNQPCGIAIDSLGNIFISDGLNSRIRKIDAITGIISTVIGDTAGFAGDGGPATAAILNEPGGICFDKYGNF